MSGDSHLGMSGVASVGLGLQGFLDRGVLCRDVACLSGVLTLTSESVKAFEYTFSYKPV